MSRQLLYFNRRLTDDTRILLKMDYKKICARNMHFKLRESDKNEKTLDTLKKLAEKKNLNAMMTKNGDILLSGDKSIQMKYGERTLQNWLGTEYTPMRMQDFDPLPNTFLLHYFAEGYNADKVLYKIGKKFEEALINRLVKQKDDRNKKRNEEMLQSNPCDLVEGGTIHMNQLQQSEENKNLSKKLKSRQEF